MADKVRFLKEDKKEVEIMSSVVDEILMRGQREGRKEGQREEKKEAARRMLSAGKYSLEEIINISGLSIDEVKQLQNEKSA